MVSRSFIEDLEIAVPVSVWFDLLLQLFDGECFVAAANSTCFAGGIFIYKHEFPDAPVCQKG